MIRQREIPQTVWTSRARSQRPGRAKLRRRPWESNLPACIFKRSARELLQHPARELYVSSLKELEQFAPNGQLVIEQQGLFSGSSIFRPAIEHVVVQTQFSSLGPSKILGSRVMLKLRFYVGLQSWNVCLGFNPPKFFEVELVWFFENE